MKEKNSRRFTLPKNRFLAAFVVVAVTVAALAVTMPLLGCQKYDKCPRCGMAVDGENEHRAGCGVMDHYLCDGNEHSTDICNKVPETEPPTTDPAVSDPPTTDPTASDPAVTEPISTEPPATQPTQAPTVKPTQAPTVKPTQAPTVKPTQAPTVKPTQAPTVKPTDPPATNPPIGDGVYYKIENGTLTIYGNGKMQSANGDSENIGYVPWENQKAQITKAVVEDGVTHIAYGAFNDMPNLTTVVMADSVVSAGFACFDNCPKLASVKLSANLQITSSEDCFSMFSGCTSLKEIALPASLTAIPDYMFFDCTALEKIVIPNGVTYIGMEAFSDCTALKSVTLPASITEIGDLAFFNCTALESINLHEGITVSSTAFDNCPKLEENIDQ